MASNYTCIIDFFDETWLVATILDLDVHPGKTDLLMCNFTNDLYTSQVDWLQDSI
jgi:hypothetical protein